MGAIMTKIRVLDLCCGLGGLSAGFQSAGCDVVTVDVDPRVTPSIVSDVRVLEFEPGSFDVVLAAPPCTEYSRLGFRGLRGPCPQPDTSIWDSCVAHAVTINPRAFVLENVRSASLVHGPAVMSAGGRFFWGWFPSMTLPAERNKTRGESARWVRDLVPDSRFEERRYWARSFVGPELAGALARAVLSQPTLF